MTHSQILIELQLVHFMAIGVCFTPVIRNKGYLYAVGYLGKLQGVGEKLPICSTCSNGLCTAKKQS